MICNVTANIALYGEPGTFDVSVKRNGRRLRITEKRLISTINPVVF